MGFGRDLGAAMTFGLSVTTDSPQPLQSLTPASKAWLDWESRIRYPTTPRDEGSRLSTSTPRRRNQLV